MNKKQQKRQYYKADNEHIKQLGNGFDSRLGHLYNLSDYQKVACNMKGTKFAATPKAALNRDNCASEYEPKLVTPAAGSVDQRRYIKYRIWNQDKGKYVYAKDYEVNKVPERERNKFARARIQEIKNLLSQGFVKSPWGIKAEEEKRRYAERIKELTISSAIEIGLEEKKSLNLRQIHNYTHRSRIFIAWLKAMGYNNIPAYMFRVEKVKEFVSYLRNIRKCAPRTINNYLLDMSTLLNVCVENDLLERNYFPDVKKDRVGIGKNWSYSIEQQKEILQYIRVHKPHFLLLVQFIFYTCAREKELSYMKIEDIGKRHPDQIWFPEDHTKEIMERNVMIPVPLQKIIEENNLKSYPGHWYVFGKNFAPSPQQYSSKNWGTRYRENILEKIGGYDSRYTLYSWKHTGVTMLHINGAELSAIQQHVGHRSPYSLLKYLKTLGLHTNKSILEKFPSLPA